MISSEMQEVSGKGFVGAARKALEWMRGEQENVPLISGWSSEGTKKGFRESPQGRSFLMAASYVREAANRHGFDVRSSIHVKNSEFGDGFTHPIVNYSLSLVPKRGQVGEGPHRQLEHITKDLANAIVIHEISTEEVYFNVPPGDDAVVEILQTCIDGIGRELIEGDL